MKELCVGPVPLADEIVWAAICMMLSDGRKTHELWQEATYHPMIFRSRCNAILESMKERLKEGKVVCPSVPNPVAEETLIHILLKRWAQEGTSTQEKKKESTSSQKREGDLLTPPLQWAEMGRLPAHVDFSRAKEEQLHKSYLEGAHYTITVELDPKQTSRAIHQFILFTFRWDNEDRSSKAHPFVVRRALSALIAARPSDIEKCKLSVDSVPFVPATLRNIFDRHPGQFFPLPFQSEGHSHGQLETIAPLPYANRHMLNPKGGLYMPGAAHLELPHGKDISQYRKLSRLLYLESVALENNMIHHSVYGKRLHPIKIDRKRRRWKSLNEEFSGRYGGALEFLHPFVSGHKDDTVQPWCNHVDTSLHAFALRLPELLEGRPAVSHQDLLFLRPLGNIETEIVGTVLSLDGEWCLVGVIKDAAERELGFPDENLLLKKRQEKKTKKIEGVDVHARFYVSDLPIRNMQDAIHRCCLFPFYLPACRIPGVQKEESSFASGTDEEEEEEDYTVVGKTDPSASIPADLNPEQRAIVHHFSTGTQSSKPYIVLGPPGTGKTRTVIAAVVATVERAEMHDESLVLACAPSDFAADIIASGLIEAGIEKKILRMNDPRRAPATLKEGVMSVSLFDEKNSRFRWPSLSELQQTKVLVCTCFAAGFLAKYYTQNIDPRNATPPHPSANSSFFYSLPSPHTRIIISKCIIDEAGQALVTEALIPLSLVSSGPTVLGNGPKHLQGITMLVGDPHQLGPVVHSKAAAALGVSLLERWCQALDLKPNTPSSSGVYLIRNYRSHRDLLHIPGKLFYEGQLVSVCADDDEEVQLPEDGEDELGWRDDENQLLTTKPVMFYGCLGKQESEPDAPSYFNLLEASTVVSLVDKLLVSKAGKITAVDIGIMATYRLQVRKIRNLLRERGLGAIRVGTVDDYQGQEAKIVFISSVVTKPTMLSQGSGGQRAVHLSFLSSAKRFNVAISRARAMLVVVGHPGVLESDNNWRLLLEHCIDNDTFHGSGKYLVTGEEVAGESSRDINDLSEAVDKIAELALLGPGDLSKIFPESLDDVNEFADAFADDLTFRVML